MAKAAREKIKLVSSANTGHFYTTTKNKKNVSDKQKKNPSKKTSDKLELSKYDPVVRKHVMYKEAKIK